MGDQHHVANRLLFSPFNYFLLYLVSTTDILYTGLMSHKSKEYAHWKTTFSVIRDLEVFKAQVCEAMH